MPGSVLDVPGFAVSTIAPASFPRPQATNTCMLCVQLGCQKQSSWKFKKHYSNVMALNVCFPDQQQQCLPEAFQNARHWSLPQLYKVRHTRRSVKSLLGDASACWRERHGSALDFTSNSHIIFPALPLLCPTTVFMLSFACFFGSCFVLLRL